MYRDSRREWLVVYVGLAGRSFILILISVICFAWSSLTSDLRLSSSAARSPIPVLLAKV
jgi:hypothetical protein